MDTNLGRLRERWEKGTRTVAEFNRNDALHTITHDDGHLYSMYRYFKLGDEWHVSADLQSMGAEVVIVHLSEFYGEQQ